MRGGKGTKEAAIAAAAEVSQGTKGASEQARAIRTKNVEGNFRPARRDVVPALSIQRRSDATLAAGELLVKLEAVFAL